MDKELFIKKILEMRGDIDRKSAEKMFSYYCALTEKNRYLNLTAVTDPEEAAEKHFIDSITAQRFLPEGSSVADVGTGGGFPGVPLKIVRPDIRLTLIDATEKKIKAVAEICSSCGIEARTVCMRAEEAGKGLLRESFDVVLARAVANLPVLTELCVPLAKKGGLFIAYKSADAGDIKDLSFLSKLNCVLEEKLTERDKTLLVFRKIEKTPADLPRSYARIKKTPL